jgi:hypothetical protein
LALAQAGCRAHICLFPATVSTQTYAYFVHVSPRRTSLSGYGCDADKKNGLVRGSNPRSNEDTVAPPTLPTELMSLFRVHYAVKITYIFTLSAH